MLSTPHCSIRASFLHKDIVSAFFGNTPLIQTTISSACFTVDKRCAMIGTKVRLWRSGGALLDLGLNDNYLIDIGQEFIAAGPLVDEVDTYGRPVDLKLRGNVTWSHQDWTVSGFINQPICRLGTLQGRRQSGSPAASLAVG